ncbi:MAG: hypothetical protein HY907_19260 [Deltaproteobacteria bacterium]|nr:hypothetical protein [Deltaproteobacteria bacterium]
MEAERSASNARVMATVSAAVAVAVWAWGSGCTRHDPAQTSPRAPAAVPSFYFYPPDFEGIGRPDDYDDSHWRDVVERVHAEWFEWVPAYAADQGVAALVHATPSGGCFPPDGIGVGIFVAAVREEATGKSDSLLLYLTADVVFVDASGNTLFQTRIERSDVVHGIVELRASSLRGRLTFASLNLLQEVLRALRQRWIAPLPG